ncbi:hypothetical protein [Pantoea stewartii]|uniref:hypothetical protein n=1 Tax=Pantoea stewartii TaxID=66269 RepID=UPI00345C58C4
MIKYESMHEKKQLRRIMLDVYEVCPARFRKEVLGYIRILKELDGLGIYDILELFHRLQTSRISKNHSANQKDILKNVYLWFDAYYFKRTKENYAPVSKVQRYDEFRKEKLRREMLKSTQRENSSHPYMPLFLCFDNLVLVMMLVSTLAGMLLMALLESFFSR